MKFFCERCRPLPTQVVGLHASLSCYPERGAPFKKTKEYPDLLGYTADCMEKHDPEQSLGS